MARRQKVPGPGKLKSAGRSEVPRERLPARSPGPRAAWRSGLLLTTVAAACVGVVLIAITALPRLAGGTVSTGPSNRPGLVSPTDFTPTDRVDGASLGSLAAPLSLDVYSDFQCPVCVTFDREVVQRLVGDFVAPGYVRLNEHDIAILGNTGSAYDESLEAATAAGCANLQGKYWPFHDWLFANQNGENRGAFSRQRLDAIATALGLDRTAFDACMTGQSVRAAVRTATEQALARGVNETPTLYIAGQPVVGLQPYAQLATYLRSRLHLPLASP